jgi:hypothetical protein
MYVTLKIFTDRLGVPVSMLPEKYAFDLTGYINGLIGTALDNVDHITFDTTPTGTPTEGTLVWNSDNGTLDLGLGGGDVVLQVGQQNMTRVINDTSAILLKSDYKVVYPYDAFSERVSVRLARADATATKDVLGLVVEDIAVLGEGFVCTLGEVANIDTTGVPQGEIWMDGDILYLSPTVAGGLTNVKPTSPNYRVIVGYVEYTHATLGKIYVKPNYGYGLADIQDVYVPTTPSNNDVLTWVSANSRAEFLPSGSSSTPDLCSVLTVGNTACLDIDLNQNDLTNVGSIDFDITPANTGATARMQWNDVDGTLDVGLKGGNVTLQVGQEMVARVVNKTGTNLTEAAYAVVRVDDAQGQRLAVDFAQADTATNAKGTLGIVTEDIAVNQEGFITILGQVREINTTGSLQGETWVDGDELWLSPTTPGGLTNVRPTAPDFKVSVGYVEYSHINHGKIYVRPGEAIGFDDLHNMNQTGTETTGQVMTWLSGGYGEFVTPPYPSYLKNSVLQSVTGTTTATILQSILIPANTYTSGDVIAIMYRCVKSGTNSTALVRLHINTSVSTTGMLTITGQTLAAAGTFLQVERTLNIISATNTQLFGAASALATDSQNSATAVTSLNIDWTVDQYIFTVATLGSAADTVTSNFIHLTKR